MLEKMRNMTPYRANERGLSAWDKQKTVPNIVICNEALQQVGEHEE